MRTYFAKNTLKYLIELGYNCDWDTTIDDFVNILREEKGIHIRIAYLSTKKYTGWVQYINDDKDYYGGEFNSYKEALLFGIQHCIKSSVEIITSEQIKVKALELFNVLKNTQSYNILNINVYYNDVIIRYSPICSDGSVYLVDSYTQFSIKEILMKL